MYQSKIPTPHAFRWALFFSALVLAISSCTVAPAVKREPLVEIDGERNDPEKGFKTIEFKQVEDPLPLWMRILGLRRPPADELRIGIIEQPKHGSLDDIDETKVGSPDDKQTGRQKLYSWPQGYFGPDEIKFIILHRSKVSEEGVIQVFVKKSYRPDPEIITRNEENSVDFKKILKNRKIIRIEFKPKTQLKKEDAKNCENLFTIKATNAPPTIFTFSSPRVASCEFGFVAYEEYPKAGGKIFPSFLSRLNVLSLPKDLVVPYDVEEEQDLLIKLQEILREQWELTPDHTISRLEVEKCDTGISLKNPSSGILEFPDLRAYGVHKCPFSVTVNDVKIEKANLKINVLPQVTDLELPIAAGESNKIDLGKEFGLPDIEEVVVEREPRQGKAIPMVADGGEEKLPRGKVDAKLTFPGSRFYYVPSENEGKDQMLAKIVIRGAKSEEFSITFFVASRPQAKWVLQTGAVTGSQVNIRHSAVGKVGGKDKRRIAIDNRPDHGEIISTEFPILTYRHTGQCSSAGESSCLDEFSYRVEKFINGEKNLRLESEVGTIRMRFLPAPTPPIACLKFEGKTKNRNVLDAHCSSGEPKSKKVFTWELINRSPGVELVAVPDEPDKAELIPSNFKGVVQIALTVRAGELDSDPKIVPIHFSHGGAPPKSDTEKEEARNSPQQEGMERPEGLRAGAPAKPLSTISKNNPAVFPIFLKASQKTTTMVKSAEKVTTLVSAKSMPEKPESPIRPRMVRHRVRKGESLKLISKKYYGNSHRWREIYRTNGHRIKRPNLIFPGQIILVPMAAKRDLKANRLLEEILNYRDTSRHPIFQKEARRRAG